MMPHAFVMIIAILDSRVLIFASSSSSFGSSLFFAPLPLSFGSVLDGVYSTFAFAMYFAVSGPGLGSLPHSTLLVACQRSSPVS